MGFIFHYIKVRMNILHKGYQEDHVIILWQCPSHEPIQNQVSKNIFRQFCNYEHLSTNFSIFQGVKFFLETRNTLICIIYKKSYATFSNQNKWILQSRQFNFRLIFAEIKIYCGQVFSEYSTIYLNIINFAKSLYSNMKIKSHNAINNGKKQTSTSDSPTQKYSKIVSRNDNNNKTKVPQYKSKQNIQYFSNKKPQPNKLSKPVQNTKTLKTSRVVVQFNALDEYQKSIVKYIRSTEYKYQISNNYLRNMDNITHQHRATFVKHFFKVAKKFHLKRNTIYLAVYYMDAYFQKTTHIQKKEAIIAAQACLFIATKYEQIYPPDLEQWSQATKQIIMAQSQILKCLDFSLSYTTTENFLDYYFSKLDLPQKDKDSIRVISDVALFDESMYGYGPAQLALSILYSIVNRNKIDQKVQMSLKWMLERNQKYMEWLQTINFKKK